MLDDVDRAAYSNRFALIRRDLRWLAHASCLMDTHHHAVVETAEPNLGLGMRRLLGGHARWFNVRHGREGSVFAQHFWSQRISDEAWLFRACLYVVLNPVVAGVCAHRREWRWCSYHATAEGDRAAYAPGEERLLGMFGSSPAEARRRYAEVVDEAVEVILAVRSSSTAETWEALRDFKPLRAS